jgi:hypothetical protein
MTLPWRVGTKLGRTLYRDEVLVGLVDTPEIAAEIVAAMNALANQPAAPARTDKSDRGKSLTEAFTRATQYAVAEHAGRTEAEQAVLDAMAEITDDDLQMHIDLCESGDPLLPSPYRAELARRGLK